MGEDGQVQTLELVPVGGYKRNAEEDPRLRLNSMYSIYVSLLFASFMNLYYFVHFSIFFLMWSTSFAIWIFLLTCVHV